MPPKVSVLIPTYNYARFLNEAIESVLNQTFTDFELVIVDNNSTDNTKEVVDKYSNDKRLRYYKNETNIGIIGNFNKCLEYANGDYIKYLMADDLFHKQLLEKFVAVMEEYPNVSLVTSYNEIFGTKKKQRRTQFNNLHSGEEIIHECLMNGRGNMIGEPTSVMFRKKHLGSQGFNPEYTALTDLNLWLRLLTKGDGFFIPEVLSYFRMHETQTTNLNLIKNRFDEYFFYKILQTKNDYNTDISKLNLDKVIKTKAIKSGRAMYLVANKLYKKDNRIIFKKSFRIAYTEGVVLESLFSRILKLLKNK